MTIFLTQVPPTGLVLWDIGPLTGLVLWDVGALSGLGSDIDLEKNRIQLDLN